MTERAESEHANGLSRRTLLKAGAWATPVVLVAVSTPIAAASTEVELTALSGEVSGLHITFADVEAGDTVPLVFEATVGGVGYSGSASATLFDADGIAEWDESVDGGGIALATIDEGYLFLPLAVLALGEFSVNIAIGSQSWIFSVSLTGA